MKIVNIEARSNITIKRIIGALYRRFIEIPHFIMWTLPFNDSIRNRKKLNKYHNLHKGKRCFIVANGPSLKETDLSLLENEITIGMNRIYLLEKINGFKPTYLASIDIPVQLSQFTKEYNDLNMVRFYNWNYRSHFKSSESLLFLRGQFNSAFNTNILDKGVGNSKSVTYACMHLAYFMGCSEVILIGKDHSYNTGNATQGTRLINSTGNESNHFIEGYYKKGMKWGMPDYKMEEYTYKLAKEAFEKEGKKIIDATIGGKLEVFEKVDYYTLFK